MAQNPSVVEIRSPELQAWLNSPKGRLVRGVIGGALLSTGLWMSARNRRGTAALLSVIGGLQLTAGILDLFPPGLIFGTSIRGSEVRNRLATYEGKQIERALKDNQLHA